MEDAHLGRLLKSLGPVELRAFDRFLCSPYFNTREDVYLLFKTIRPSLETRQPLPDRAWIFQTAFPDKHLSDREIRLMMTYLVRLFGQFIQMEQVALEPALGDWLEIKALYRLDLKIEGDKAIKSAFSRLEKDPLRNVAYHDQQYRLLFEQVRQHKGHLEKTDLHLHELTDRLHRSVAGVLLRQACLLLSEKAVYKMEPDTRFLPEVFQWAEMEDHLTIPAVAAYYYACKMLTGGQEIWFQQLKNTVLVQGSCFPSEELLDLHMIAINYCVRQLNKGNERYFQEVHELYKAGLETKTLLHNGVILPFTYYNIVISGLKINALDWVAWFIPQYKNNLERPFRDSAYSFNMARLHYARRDYGEALLLLQKANYRDMLTNLAAKTMALKIYFEQGEYDVLQSHLHAMTHYIRRKRVIGYHRENYLNIIRITKKLLGLPAAKAVAHQRLREQIESTEPLTEKRWFLEMMDVIYLSKK